MRKKTHSALENLRRARTLNQATLADLVGVSQQTISKAERGLLPLTKDVQERIATILGVERREIFPSEQSEQDAVSA